MIGSEPEGDLALVLQGSPRMSAFVCEGVVDGMFTLGRARGASACDALVATALTELDRFGVARAGIAVEEGDAAAHAALTNHAERFFAIGEVDPHAGMPELRRLEGLARAYGLRAVTVSPSLLRPPLAIDDRRFYPVFAKCVELDVAICPSLGVPAERVPLWPQKVERIDEVACRFPELRIVMKHGCEPWQALAVLLMRKHANLFYLASALRPTRIPPEIVAFANEDGAHKILFASHPPAGVPREQIWKELPEAGFARSVWPRFLRDNAFRVFRLS